MTMDFNPNKTKKQFLWATYVPRHRPEFKPHAQRGHALQRISLHKIGILYKWNAATSEWDEVSRADDWNKAPKQCESCGKDLWVASGFRHNAGYNGGARVWVDKDTNPRMVPVCYDCSRRYR